MSSQSPIEIPDALTLSDEFKRLNSKQVSNFVARLGYVDEVVETLHSFLRGGAADESLREFLDNLELDVFFALVFSSNPEEHQSNYLVHSSWSFECTPQQLAEIVGEDLMTGGAGASKTAFATESELIDWIRDVAKRLELALKHFVGSRVYCSAIAHLMVLDAVLTELLSGLIRARFNPNLDLPSQ
ncbi:MAG: hypothetical protein IPH30_16580 [Betaproteobacteria bacterium]|nr:hypothetical protein [Betaproteobacteria bacterium]